MRNFVTIGAPNNGIEFSQYCAEGSSGVNIFCEIQDKINAFPDFGPYSKLVQMTLGPSNYLRQHHKHDDYVKSSHFLPTLNNERHHDKVDS